MLFRHNRVVSCSLSADLTEFSLLNVVSLYDLCYEWDPKGWKLVLISSSLNLPQKQEIPCLMCEFRLFFLECHKNLLRISCDISDSLSFFLSPDFKSKIIPPFKCSHPINLSSFKTTKERLSVFLKIHLEVD